MERTKKIDTFNSEEDRRIRWKKTGRGSFRFQGRIIKPGETFLATPEQIPAAFRDIVYPLDSVKEKEAAPLKVTKSVYEVKPRGKSKSQFDVVDGNGKVLNEKVLSKELAEKLVSDLSK